MRLITPSLIAAFVLAGLTVGVPAMLSSQTVVSSGGVYIGIKLIDIDEDRASELKLPVEAGVEVKAVAEDSPAAAAGIRPGDALLSYNGESILGGMQFIRLVSETPPWRQVKIRLWRSGKIQTVTVAPAAIPAGRSIFDPGSHFLPSETPDRSVAVPDIPSVLLIWKNVILGIECESITSQLSQFFGVKNGVLVRSVDHGTSGDRAGLRAGDILISIGDKTVHSPRDLGSFQRSFTGDLRSIPVSVVRERKTLSLQLHPAPSGPE